MRFIRVKYPTSPYEGLPHPLAAYVDVEPPEAGARPWGPPQWGMGTMAITWVVDQG